ncbi:DUF424 family protein [Candidatus Pacearchaeota archaeon]|nr:DUF424 family protein [Candidatus Pacearchaeota archaeon]
MDIYIKIHRSYRNVVAIADSVLLGKKFEEGIKQLDVRENFYNGMKIESEEEALRVLKMQIVEDSTFNIVGGESVKLAIKAGIIAEGSFGHIANIPYALKLL